MGRMTTRYRVRLGLECFTSATALVGGLLPAARPDGVLLRAEQSALVTSPFSDRLPGVLTTLVGGGFSITAECQRRQWAHERDLAIFAGTGLIVFELTELAWIGFQPLEAVFGIVGATIALLAVRGDPEPPRPAGSEGRNPQHHPTEERQRT